MRLLTYNIHKGIGGRDRRYRLERIIQVIEEENPDLICLQEVVRNTRRAHYDDQPKLLAEYFRPAAELFQLNVRLRDGGYGNLVLSRWPFVSKHQITLRLGRRKPRGAQLVIVDTPEGRLSLVNWHLGLVERERHWQANRLLEHRLLRDSLQLPTLIAGDFNDWRNTLAPGPFARHGFLQLTAPPSRFRSFPAWLTIGSLDKVFSNKRFVHQHARIVRTRLARRASDHLPLVVDFHLAGALPSIQVE